MLLLQFLDRNECLDSPCLSNGTCTNTEGSYVCNCTEGWTNHNCDKGLLKHNENSSSKSLAFKKDNDFLKFHWCIFADVDECTEYEPCQNNGTCVNNNGSYTCICTTGWQGKHCDDGKIHCTVSLYFYTFSS
jgi:hypothetical protein